MKTKENNNKDCNKTCLSSPHHKKVIIGKKVHGKTIGKRQIPFSMQIFLFLHH